MIIKIGGELYDKAVIHSENMACSKKRGRFGKGVINSKKDPYKVERVGVLGEAALGLLLGLEPDFEYRSGGDKYDFKMGCLTIDIKTSVRKENSKKRIRRCLVKYIDKRGYVNLKCDIYVAAELLYEDRVKGEAEVDIYGYTSRSGLKDMPTAPGIFGYEKGVKGWRNYELRENRLNNIQELIDIKEILL